MSKTRKTATLRTKALTAARPEGGRATRMRRGGRKRRRY